MYIDRVLPSIFIIGPLLSNRSITIGIVQHPRIALCPWSEFKIATLILLHNPLAHIFSASWQHEESKFLPCNFDYLIFIKNTNSVSSLASVVKDMFNFPKDFLSSCEIYPDVNKVDVSHYKIVSKNVYSYAPIEDRYIQAV